ncbi:DUF4381 domain-containing protein [Agarivorans sp. MS3-6]
MPEQSDLLANLEDIILPTHYETALPAVGWWLLAMVIIAALVGLLFSSWRYWQLCKPRREALQLLNQAELTLSETNQLMKRLALSYYPRQQVASLSGEAWLSFLDSTLKGNSSAFISIKQQWQQQLYAPSPSTLDADTAALCKRWVRNLRPPVNLRSFLSLAATSNQQSGITRGQDV